MHARGDDDEECYEYGLRPQYTLLAHESLPLLIRWRIHTTTLTVVFARPDVEQCSNQVRTIHVQFLKIQKLKVNFQFCCRAECCALNCAASNSIQKFMFRYTVV